jgi:hypothetical protein
MKLIASALLLLAVATLGAGCASVKTGMTLPEVFHAMGRPPDTIETVGSSEYLVYHFSGSAVTGRTSASPINPEAAISPHDRTTVHHDEFGRNDAAKELQVVDDYFYVQMVDGRAKWFGFGNKLRNSEPTGHGGS